MNDTARNTLGILGTLAGIGLSHVATLAAILASVATAIFMTLSALEKWEARRAARRPRAP